MRIATFIAAGVLGLFSLGLLAGGGMLLWGDSQKDDDGFVTTDSARFATNTYAMSTETLDFEDLDSVDWLIDRDDWGKLRLSVQPRGEKPLFVGVARTRDVDGYLGGAHRDLITDVRFEPFRANYRELDGDARPAPPAEQGFWAASAHGAGTQELTWEVENGDWSIVVMNEDASRRIDAAVEAGADLPFLDDAGWVTLAAGLLALSLAATLAVVGVRGTRRAAVAA
jgi:hypothetical protein